MQKNNFIMLVLIISFSLLLTGCGKKATDDNTQKPLSQSGPVSGCKEKYPENSCDLEKRGDFLDGVDDFISCLCNLSKYNWDSKICDRAIPAGIQIPNQAAQDVIYNAVFDYMFGKEGAKEPTETELLFFWVNKCKREVDTYTLRGKQCGLADQDKCQKFCNDLPGANIDRLGFYKFLKTDLNSICVCETNK